MTKKSTILWLDSLVAQWQRSVAGGRPAHALLLAGSPGVGKRSFAAWIASQKLQPGRAPERPLFPLAEPQVADLHWLRPEEDKKSIKIEQVRELVAELALTSYEGRGKVAVIEPADAMTPNAANSLLKTLEEPAGDALLILVVDRAGRLPATVRSRCLQLQVPLPPQDECLAWLERWQAGAPWAQALRQAGGAPLAAITELERLDAAAARAADLAALAERRGSPVETAARWAREDPADTLVWLAREVERCIRRSCGVAGPAADAAVPDSVLQRMDSKNLFCYLDIINGLRRQAAGSFNVQMTLESLLIDWTEGLANCRDANAAGALLPSAGNG